jgi:hypothetical protein
MPMQETEHKESTMHANSHERQTDTSGQTDMPGQTGTSGQTDKRQTDTSEQKDKRQTDKSGQTDTSEQKDTSGQTDMRQTTTTSRRASRDVLIGVSSVSGTDGFLFEGRRTGSTTSTGSPTGTAVQACDVNGDGYADMIVGAPDGYLADFVPGYVYVVFGKANGWPRVFNKDTALTGSNGFTIRGRDSEFAAPQFGKALACGDVNNDGYMDILIGAPEDSEVFVVFGKAPQYVWAAELNVGILDGRNGFSFFSSGYQGLSIASCDVDGDKISDLISTWVNDAVSMVLVIWGKTTGWASTVSTSFLAEDEGFYINIEDDVYVSVGMLQVACGDINGDGVSDVVIGSQNSRGSSSGFNRGEVFTYLCTYIYIYIIRFGQKLGICMYVRTCIRIALASPKYRGTCTYT